MVLIDDLKNTFIEEYEGVLDEMLKFRFKNATILLSKSLFAVCDLLIYTKTENLPKNHSERFKILKEYFPKIYCIFDSIWSEYVDSYSKPSNKEICEKIKNAIKKIREIENLPEEIKKIIDK